MGTRQVVCRGWSGFLRVGCALSVPVWRFVADDFHEGVCTSLACVGFGGVDVQVADQGAHLDVGRVDAVLDLPWVADIVDSQPRFVYLVARTVDGGHGSFLYLISGVITQLAGEVLAFFNGEFHILALGCAVCPPLSVDGVVSLVRRGFVENPSDIPTLQVNFFSREPRVSRLCGSDGNSSSVRFVKRSLDLIQLSNANAAWI